MLCISTMCYGYDTMHANIYIHTKAISYIHRPYSHHILKPYHTKTILIILTGRAKHSYAKALPALYHTKTTHYTTQFTIIRISKPHLKCLNMCIIMTIAQHSIGSIAYHTQPAITYNQFTNSLFYIFFIYLMTYDGIEVVMYISLRSGRHNSHQINMYQVNIKGQTTEWNPEFCRQKLLHNT